MKTLHAIHFVTLLASLAGADPKHQWKFERPKPVKVEAPPPPIQTAPPLPADPEPSVLQEKLTRKLMAEQVNSLKQDIRDEFEALATKLAAELKPPQLPPMFEQVPAPGEVPPPQDAPAMMQQMARNVSTETVTDWLDAVLTVDEDAPKRMMGRPKTEIEVACPVWCVNCDPIIKAMGEHPNYKFVSKNIEPPEVMNHPNGMFPAARDPETGRWFWGKNWTNWDTMLKRMNEYRFHEDVPKLAMRPEKFSAGTLSIRDMLEFPLKTIQRYWPNQRPIQLDTAEFRYGKGPFSVYVPPRITLGWQTQNAATRFVINPPMTAGLGVFGKTAGESVGAVSVSLERINLEATFPISFGVE